MSLPRRAPTADAAVFGLTLLLTLWWFPGRAFYDPGSLWHTVVGEQILADGFMTTDSFTFTHAGRHWIPQQWGSEVVMALLHHAGGLDLQLLGLSVFVAWLMTFLTLRLRQAGMHLLLAVTVAGGAVLASAFHLYVRPHLATVGLMAVLAAVIVDHDARRIPAKRLWLLPLLGVIWTNLHGGVIAGIATWGLAVCAWAGHAALDRWRGHVEVHLDLPRLAGVTALLAASVVVNPFGTTLLSTWSRIVGSPALKAVVSEHQSLRLDRGPDLVLAALCVCFAVYFLGSAPNWHRRFRLVWLLPLVWMGLTVSSVRHGPIFAVVAAVVAADLWPHTAWRAWLARHGDSLAYGNTEARWTQSNTVIAVMLVTAVVATQRSGWGVPVVGAGWARLDPRAVPVDLTGAIEAVRARDPEGRFYNDCNLGGYLIRFHPGLPVTMDDRFELYSDEWILAHVDTIKNNPQAIEAFCDEYGCRYALVEANPRPHALARYLAGSGRWRRLVSGESAALYERSP